jgi:hypothetical protein
MSFQSHAALTLRSKPKYAISYQSADVYGAAINGGDLPAVGISAICPNPLVSNASIAFALDRQTHVRLRIYDASGRLVRTLVDETKAAGDSHSVIWDGTDDLGQSLPAGVYFCRFITENLSQSRKMILLK